MSDHFEENGSIRNVAVIGAGQMGTGIAQVCASVGIDVTLFDLEASSLEKAVQTASARLSRNESAGSVKAAGDLKDIASAEVVIEAVNEDLKIKRKVFSELDEASAPDAILATNTSSLLVSEIASATSRPERVVGIHFMNPPQLMKLVEVVRARDTSDASLAKAEALVRQIGKTAVVVVDAPCFIVNRLLMPLINEAGKTLEQGTASSDDIDKAMKLGANFPMGPLHLADLIGIDVVVEELKVLEKHFGVAYAPCAELLRLAECGELGRKTGKGFFDYARKADKG